NTVERSFRPKPNKGIRRTPQKNRAARFDEKLGSCANGFPNFVDTSQLCKYSASKGPATSANIAMWRLDFSVAYRVVTKRRSSLARGRFGDMAMTAAVSRISNASGKSPGS